MRRTDDEPRRFSKTVAIKTTDEDERTATGIVLKPYELDRQLDWLDVDGVKAMFNPDPADGVMHAYFPDGHATLDRNEILESDEEIDGYQFGKGDWVIRRQYANDQRWQLVKDGVLSAYSIGGEVSEVVQYDSIDDLPDEVRVPAVVDPETVPEKYHPIEKITDGDVSEISDVDIGAVTSASHAVVMTIAKDILAVTDDRQEFVSRMQERGGTEDGANALYAYMTDEEDTDEMSKSHLPDDATLGRRFKSLLFGGSDNSERGTDESLTKAMAKLTDEQADLTQQAIDDFVDAQGADANVETLREWLWNMDDELDPNVRTALDAALDEFYSQQRPQNQSVGGAFAEWVNGQADIELTIDTTMTDTDDDPTLAEKNATRLDEIAQKLDQALDGGGDGEGSEKTLPEQNAAKLDDLTTKLDDALGIEGTEGDGEGTEKALPEQNAEQIAEIGTKLDKLVAQGGASESQQAGKTADDENTTKAAIELEKEVFTR